MQRSETPPVGAPPPVDINLMFPSENPGEAPSESSIDWPARIDWPQCIELSGVETQDITLTDKPDRPEPPSEVPTSKVWVRSPRRHYGEWRLPQLQWRAYAVPVLAVIVIAEAIAIGVQRYSPSAAVPVTAAGTRPFAIDVPQLAHTVTSPGFAAAPVAATDSIKSVTPSAAAAKASLVSPAPARSGWVEVRSPVDVDVWEGRRRLGESSRDRIALSEGDHEIELVNDQLGFRESKRVRVTRGRVATVSPVLPTGVLHVNASPWAEVSLDGQALGTTPLGDVRAAIGGHDLTFRHPQLGNRTVHVTVTVGTPVRTGVDMREQ